ncbi:ABC transporter permease [Ruania alba]|uniref:Osmoprotectant transport system permease protein n=1 Tax=Ruania alba TaxID=648782 RepID=A0A1H5GP36_9MICO|nr:ABC transporter permease subunit [Ruania alba]SEE17542.1 osmoprotectant transport system permease protein [Ruania alba]
MSVDTEHRGADRGTTARPTILARGWTAYAVRPVLLAALCAATWWWISARELDSIEARILTADNLSTALLEHVRLSLVSFAIVLVLAVPIGVVVTRRYGRWLIPVVTALGNLGQAVPKIGLLIVLAIIFGLGFKIAVAGLVVGAVLVLLTNTVAGLLAIERSTLEAARGMGMGPLTVLLRVELPLAVPVIAAGARTALTLIVSYGVIAVFVNAGGLGGVLLTGIDVSRVSITFVGAVLSVTLALMADWLGWIAEDLLTPRGLAAR